MREKDWNTKTERKKGGGGKRLDRGSQGESGRMVCVYHRITHVH